MRNKDPLIIGAGPAGCAAAIVLGREGTSPILIDRDETAGDVLCGGFLSWRTLAQLAELGVDAHALGGHRVDRLALFASGKEASLPLPSPAIGLSRHALDNAMRRAAIAAGARFEVDMIRQIDGTTAIGRQHVWQGCSLFLASGKHDLRGALRPRREPDPAFGLRLRLPASALRTSLVGERIELHLFEGGYAGIVLQEGGSLNLCMAVRKSRLARCGGNIAEFLAMLGEDQPHLGQRMGDDWRAVPHDSIGAVPYGFIARDTAPGLFRLGDQAAVIPSLAGEGIHIALASGVQAAKAYGKSGADGSVSFQRAFATQARRPVMLAEFAWRLAENAIGQSLAMLAARQFASLITGLMEGTRLSSPPLPCAHVSRC